MKFYRDLFEASVSRVLSEANKKDFFLAFYEAFIHRSPETEQHFARRPSEEGRQMIYKSFFAMLTVDGALFVPDFLEQLARRQTQDGLRLPPRFLPSGGKPCCALYVNGIPSVMRRSSRRGRWR